MLAALLVLCLIGEALSWRASSGLGTRLRSLHDSGSAEQGVAMHTVKLRFRGEERTVVVPEGKTVLEAAEEVWDDTPCSCRSGICLECAGMILSGRGSLLEEDTGLDESLVNEGFTCTCQTRIAGDGAEIELGKFTECSERQYGSYESRR